MKQIGVNTRNGQNASRGGGGENFWIDLYNFPNPGIESQTRRSWLSCTDLTVPLATPTRYALRRGRRHGGLCAPVELWCVLRSWLFFYTRRTIVVQTT